MGEGKEWRASRFKLPAWCAPAASFIGLMILLLLMWYWWGTAGANWFVGRLSAHDANLTQLGQMGDVFGGVNALFAALAFGVVAVAAYFQLHTWRLAERQHTQQSFEPLFFQLVQLHRDVAKEMTLRVTMIVSDNVIESPAVAAIVRTGSCSFHNAIEGLRRGITKETNWNAEDGCRRELQEIYGELYDLNEDVLGPYFRSLYHVFKLIDQSALSLDEKVRYANIGRSTLSRDDVFLLALNGLSANGTEFVPLIEKYGILKHASRLTEADRKIVNSFYEITARLSAKDRHEYWSGNPTKAPS